MKNQKVITKEQFDLLSRPLVGMPISRAWKGYGSAIFLEFGALHEEGRKSSLFGEAGVGLEWDWRIERAQSILAGSADSTRIILNTLPKLEGRLIVDVQVEGRLPELVITLSNRVWVRSFCINRGHPQWTLFFWTLGESSWLKSHRGKLWQEWPSENIATS